MRKKNGKLRMILDTRVVNCFSRTLPNHAYLQPVLCRLLNASQTRNCILQVVILTTPFTGSKPLIAPSTCLPFLPSGPDILDRFRSMENLFLVIPSWSHALECYPWAGTGLCSSVSQWLRTSAACAAISQPEPLQTNPSLNLPRHTTHCMLSMWTISCMLVMILRSPTMNATPCLKA